MFIIYLLEMYPKLMYIYKYNTNVYFVSTMIVTVDEGWTEEKNILYVNTIEYLLFHIVSRMRISSGFPLVSRNEIIIEKYLHQ